MNWKYPLSEPLLGEEEKQAIISTLESGWLSMGPKTAEFEQKFSEMMGCKHAVAVSSGTAALHLALLALGVGDDQTDEVIQPAINFVAAANMTVAVGAKPVFADIISQTEPTIDPDQLDGLINENTKVIIAMHYGGYPAKMAELQEICQKQGLYLIEDAAHGLGYDAPELDGYALGTIGDIGCFSFFANKNMTTGEGGMVTTNSDELFSRIRILRSHGMTTLTWDRHRGYANSYDVEEHGFNYRIDDLRSSIGISQLDRLQTANHKRQLLVVKYARLFGCSDDIDVEYVFGDRAGAGAAHLAAILVPPEKRSFLRENLSAIGIQTSIHYPSVNSLSAFKDYHSISKTAISQEFSDRVVTLPLYAELTSNDVEEIYDAIMKLVSAWKDHK